MKEVCLAAVIGALCAIGLRGSEPPEPSDLVAVPTEDLIARLQEVSAQSVGANNLTWADGFIALDAPLKFRGGVLGAPAPAVPPVMRALVRRGVAALPALLGHLSDARPTKLTAGSTREFEVSAAWYADEYDPKDRARPPAGVNTTEHSGAVEPEQFEHHQVKVGDLCFVVLGQIINRSLLAVRYQPSGCLVVNSPVKTPGLAAAARVDWSGLTAGQFKEFLIKDTTDRRPDATATGALQRLLFYDPDEGKALAVRWLEGPLFNVEPVRKFVEGPLRLADAAGQDRLLATFRADHGDAEYQGVVEALILTAEKSAREENTRPGSVEEYRYAARLVERRFSDAEQHPTPGGKAEDCADRLRLVEVLASFPSDEIDHAVRDVLRRTLALRPIERVDLFSQCELASACARRLCPPAGRGEITQATERLRSRTPREDLNTKALELYGQRCRDFLQGLAAALPSEEKTP